MCMISLILATYGRADEIERLMASLLAQQCRDFELLVMDQNEDDRVVPFVAAARAGGLAVRHIRLDRPGLSSARNRGIAEARGDFVAFPDDDCWYEPDTLAHAATLLVSDPALDGVVLRWVEQASARPPPTGSGELQESAWRNFRDGDASSISLLLRRTLLCELGGFDERLGVGQWFGAGEETDLVFRVLARDARVRRCPAARVHHRYGVTRLPTLGAQARSTVRRARGTGALYVKHRLALWTVLRGIVAPPVLALLRGAGWRAVVLAGAQSVGRLQGTWRWLTMGT